MLAVDSRTVDALIARGAFIALVIRGVSLLFVGPIDKMPRGIKWDDLPNNFAKFRPEQKTEEIVAPQQPVATQHNREIDVVQDCIAIGKRITFGVICGGMTGACFGFVEVLKNPKLLAGKTLEGRKKVLRFTGRFAGFFGAYHGARKIFHLYVPLSPEMNVGAAAATVLTPMLVLPALRPLFPYAVVMIGLDAFNGLNDI